MHELIGEFKAKRNIKKLKKLLAAEDTKQKILDFLRDEFTDFGADIVNDALSDLKLELTSEDSTGLGPIIKPPPVVGIKGIVLGIIVKNKAGITKKNLVKLSKQNTRQVANALYKLKKIGLVENVSKGIYKATDVPLVKKPKKKPNVKKKPKSQKELSPRKIVYKLIKRRKKGISAAELYEKTDLTQKQIANAIFNLKKNGLISVVSKGFYQAIS